MSETKGRRVSTRYRGEPPLKTRAPEPTPPPPPHRAQPAPAVTTEPLEDGLPLQYKEGQPLPLLSEPQCIDPPLKAFQSIAESGIFAASIERSRQKWIVDGVLDRYWAKPNKKKAIGENPNPAKESMSRLGGCSLIIEPHAFEVTLYTVKEISTTFPVPNVQPPSISTSQYNPFTQSPAYTPPSRNDHHAGLNERPTSTQPTLPSFGEAFGHFTPATQATNPYQAPFVPPTSVTPSGPRSLSRTSNGHEANQDGGPSSDPVIQMLATRAASDHDLKALMKVVASGTASPEQLKDFQNHIDELNSILKASGSPYTPSQDDASTKPHSLESEIFLAHPETAAYQSSPHMTTAGPVAPLDPMAAPIKTEPPHQYYPPTFQPQVPKAKTMPYRSNIHSIVFDFGGTGDRFLFPRFSILEYLPGGTQVVVSFLIIRRGIAAMSGKYKETNSYYQPITMRLSTENTRTLEPLARIVAPPDEVRTYMDSVFDQMSPAEIVYLVIQLPRSKDGDNAEKEESPVPSDNLVKTFYQAPSLLVPLAA